MLTELICFGSKANHAKLSANDLDLQLVGIDTIHPATSVSSLGILLDPVLRRQTTSPMSPASVFLNFTIYNKSDI